MSLKTPVSGFDAVGMNHVRGVQRGDFRLPKIDGRLDDFESLDRALIEPLADNRGVHRPAGFSGGFSGGGSCGIGAVGLTSKRSNCTGFTFDVLSAKMQDSATQPQPQMRISPPARTAK